MDLDPSLRNYNDDIVKDTQKSHRKVSRSLSKQHKRHQTKTYESAHIFETQEPALSPTQERNERERKAIDYLKDLSEDEDANNSNFQEGLRNFCLSQFLEDEIREMRSRVPRKGSVSPTPLRKEATETGQIKSESQTPAVTHRKGSLDGKKKKKKKARNSISPVRLEAQKVAQPAAQGPLNKLSEDRMEWVGKIHEMIINEMKNESQEWRETKDSLILGESQENILEMSGQYLVQKLNAKYTKAMGRFPSQGRKPQGTRIMNFRASDGFLRKIDEKQMSEVILHGKSLSLPKVEKSKVASTLTRPGSQIEAAAKTHQGFGVRDILDDRKEKESEKGKNKGGQLLIDLIPGQSGNKMENSKENLQSIVKTALIAKGNPILRSRGSQDDVQNNAEKANREAILKFWSDIKDIPERCRSSSRTRANIKDTKAIDDKGNEGEKHNQTHSGLQFSAVFPSGCSSKVATTKKFAAGVQGKSVIILHPPREARPLKKGTHVSEDLEEGAPFRDTLRDSSKDQTVSKTFGPSNDLSFTKNEIPSRNHSTRNHQLQQNQFHNLLIKQKPRPRNNEKMMYVGNLQTRIISHEDVLNSIGVARDMNDSKQLCTTENTRLFHHDSSNLSKKKKREYAKRNVKKDDYQISLIKDQNQCSFFTNLKAKPLLMSLYSWDAGFRKDSI